MDWLTDAAALSIGICAVLTFYTALLHLTRKHVDRSYIFRVFRNIMVGLQSLQLLVITLGLQFVHPLFLYPFVTLLFVSGPLNYLRNFVLFRPGGKVPAPVLLLLPALPVLAWETWFYFFFQGDRSQVLRGIFSDPLSQPASIVVAVGALGLVLQYLLQLRMELDYARSTKAAGPISFSIVLTLFFLSCIGLITAGFILADRIVVDVGVFAIGATGVVYLVIENRYPHFYRLVVQEEKQQRYRKSLIQGLSKEKIMARLEELMEEDRIYRQFELKMADVASMLLISPHQLSEFINECVGCNFSSYINRYRVEEARELLACKPEQSILSIGLEVGFGSKPSFNTVFKQETGMTPTEFRKKGCYYKSGRQHPFRDLG